MSSPRGVGTRAILTRAGTTTRVFGGVREVRAASGRFARGFRRVDSDGRANVRRATLATPRAIATPRAPGGPPPNGGGLERRESRAADDVGAANARSSPRRAAASSLASLASLALAAVPRPDAWSDRAAADAHARAAFRRLRRARATSTRLSLSLLDASEGARGRDRIVANLRDDGEFAVVVAADAFVGKGAPLRSKTPFPFPPRGVEPTTRESHRGVVEHDHHLTAELDDPPRAFPFEDGAFDAAHSCVTSDGFYASALGAERDARTAMERFVRDLARCVRARGVVVVTARVDAGAGDRDEGASLGFRDADAVRDFVREACGDSIGGVEILSRREARGARGEFFATVAAERRARARIR